MSKNTVIEFHDVSKEYYLQENRTLKDFVTSLIGRESLAKQHKALQHISFSIEKGETVGIVGRNGAGKSTLLKLIAGVTAPTRGKVSVQGTVAPLIELGAGFHHELTGYENIFLNAAILGMHKKEIELVLEDIIAFSEIAEFLGSPVKRYSSGMQMRLGFSIAVHSPAPILLIDEVLAVGDAPFQEKCLKRLQLLQEQKEKTIIFISHDENAVKKFCPRAILLHEGKLIDDAPTSQVFSEYHHIVPTKS